MSYRGGRQKSREEASSAIVETKEEGKKSYTSDEDFWKDGTKTPPPSGKLAVIRKISKIAEMG